MQKISFNTYGHRNIRATHKNTIEFTKEKELSIKGDCILGVNADFDLKKIKGFIKDKKKLKLKIIVDDVSDELEFVPNQNFNDNKEMVLRLGEFKSERTLGIRAEKAAKHIKRQIVEKMKEHRKKMVVVIRKV